MNIKRIAAEDFYKSQRMSAIAFVYPYDEEKDREKDIDQHWLSCLIGAYDDAGELLANIGVIPYNVRFDGHNVKMAGIGGVTSLPETRQKGNVRAIFEYAFKEMREEGVLFSVLYPFSHDYYRMYGYELCMTYPCYTIPMNALKGYPQPYDVKMLDTGATTADFETMRAGFIADKNMAHIRGEREWKSIMGSGVKGRRYAYLMKDEHGQAEAYLVLNVEDGDNKKKLVTKDIAYADYGALRRALGFLYRLRAQYESVRICLPSTEDIINALPEPWDIKAELVKHGMARVNDVEGVLNIMALPDGAGTFSFEIFGDMIVENNGIYTVSYNNGSRTVTKGGGKPDARMDIRTFSLLALGAASYGQAQFREGLETLGNEEVLKKVFVKKPVFMTDSF